MDSMAKIYIDRAENELMLSSAIKRLSEDPKEKAHLGVEFNSTFYSAAISHSYYSIFYSAKAILLTKGIETNSPEVHKKTLEAFKAHL